MLQENIEYAVFGTIDVYVVGTGNGNTMGQFLYYIVNQIDFGKTDSLFCQRSYDRERCQLSPVNQCQA